MSVIFFQKKSYRVVFERGIRFFFKLYITFDEDYEYSKKVFLTDYGIFTTIFSVFKINKMLKKNLSSKNCRVF